MGEQAELGLPRVVKNTIAYIRASGTLHSCATRSKSTSKAVAGLEAEGVFRLSPSTALVRTLREAFDRGHPITLANYNSMPDSAAHLSASLLKLFLRTLPEPLIRHEDYSLIEKCPDAQRNDGLDAVEYIRETFLPSLAEQEGGQAKLVLLAHVLELLYEVSLRSSKLNFCAPNTPQTEIICRHDENGRS